MNLAPFLEFLEARLGPSLRAVEWYREDDNELVYIRDDLETEEVLERAEAFHKTLTGDGELMGPPVLEELGNEIATISVREKAVMIHFRIEENYGVLVGTEPEVARDLTAFITDCRNQLVEDM